MSIFHDSLNCAYGKILWLARLPINLRYNYLCVTVSGLSCVGVNDKVSTQGQYSMTT